MIKWLLLLSCFLFVLGYALKRDIRFEKEYCGDLRNRITGSRLIKDGRSPYFYKWKKGDGLRYYDPANFDTWQPANMTSTPVFYRLLAPLADRPQSWISKCWLALEYCMLAGMTLFAFFGARTDRQKQAVLLVFLFVLMTNGWKEHAASGQTYLCIPFFAMLFFGFWQKNGHPVLALAAGTAAACLVLIRLNTILFFIPFLLIARYYTRTWLLAFCIPIVLSGAWILSSQHERSLWQDYFRMLKEATKINQDLHPAVQQNEPDPHFAVWEGINLAESDEYIRTEPVKIYSENGNFFVLYKNFFHRNLSMIVLGLLSFLLIASLIVLFYLRRCHLGKENLARVAIFGFCLLMIQDLFSPIYRHQYYTVQWIFPLLVAAATYSGRQKGWYALLLAGVLLNCIHLSFIKMENTIGEYLILSALLAIALAPGLQKEQEPATGKCLRQLTGL